MKGIPSAKRTSVVTSRALDTCPASSRPCGFSKCVSVRPSSSAFSFISPTKRSTDPRSDMKGERLGGVVRARDERRPQQLGDGQLLTRAQVDGRLADPRRLRAHASRRRPRSACSSTTTAVMSFVMLAIARERARIVPREYGTVVSDEVPRSGRDRRLGSLGAGTRGKSKGRECGDESDDGEQCSAHQRATMYCRSATSPPRPRPGRRAAAPPRPRPSASPRSLSRYA